MAAVSNRSSIVKSGGSCYHGPGPENGGTPPGKRGTDNGDRKADTMFAAGEKTDSGAAGVGSGRHQRGGEQMGDQRRHAGRDHAVPPGPDAGDHGGRAAGLPPGAGAGGDQRPAGGPAEAF